MTVLRIEGRRVTCWPKPFIPLHHLPPSDARVMRKRARFRAACYRSLAAAALRQRHTMIDTLMAIDTDDAHTTAVTYRYSRFKNRKADIDFAMWTWYAGQRDRRSYATKAIRASFAGSSAGGRLNDTLQLPEIIYPSMA